MIPARYLRAVSSDRTLYMEILISIRYSLLSYKYKTYIHDILGITNDDMIAYEESITPPSSPPSFGSDFEETDDIDERDMNIQDQTCRDVILNDDMQIQEYLEEADTFLLIHKSSTDDILCYEKSYIEKILRDKANWFYECIGDLLDNGDRVMNFGNENDAYIKLPLYKDGLNGFIHLSQMRRLLQSDNRIYYVYPDNDKDITHSAAWVNVFGTNPNWVSANHCQVGSKLLVYKLKICTDPERCLRSLAYIGGE